jgi:hypothetical protein
MTAGKINCSAKCPLASTRRAASSEDSSTTQYYTSSRQTGCYIRTMTSGIQLRKHSGRESQGARHQDELIGGKPPVVK